MANDGDLEALRQEVATLHQELDELRAGASRVNVSADMALQSLANFSLVEDRHPTHTDQDYKAREAWTKFHEFEKLLKSTPPEMREAMFMLAAYCFDLSRRFAFLNSAITIELPKTAEPRPKLKRRVDDDDRELNGVDGEWRERAEIAARQLKRWHNTANGLQVDPKQRGEFR
jgi:hypothetical protein